MPIFQPTDVSGLFAWYKAHSLSLSMSGVVTNWQDSSGSGNHLSFILPSSNTTCPVYVPAQLNGYPVIRFDGSNDYLAGTGSYFGTLAPSSLTAFIVYKSNSNIKQAIFYNDNDDAGSPTVGAKNNFLLGINDAGNTSGFYYGWGKDKGVTIYTTSSTGIKNTLFQWSVRSDRWRTTDDRFVWGLNGISLTGAYTTSMSQSINNRLRVGATVVTSSPTDFFNGDIAEIAAYSRRLNETEVDQVTNYLLYKYNIPNTSPVPLFMWTTDNGSSSGLYNTVPLYSYSINTQSSGVNLYTISAVNYATGVPLFTSASASYVSGKPLYISASTPYNTGTSLYIGSATINNTGVNLYVPGGLESKSLLLYVYGYTTQQSGMRLYTGSSTTAVSGFSIYMTGYPTTHISTIPLYIGSSQTYPTGIPSYISAATTSASAFPLYTSAKMITEDGPTLFIPGQTEYLKHSLYVYGKETISTGIPFFTAASVSNTNTVQLYIGGKTEEHNQLGLFVKQLPPGTSTKSLALFITASSPGSSGLYNVSPLYLYGYGIAESMPLFISNGEDYHAPTGLLSMPLFLKAPNLASGIDNYTSLVVYNNATITGKMTKLYVRGDGVMDGASIYNGNMNLFLKANDGSEKGVSLYIQNNTNITSGVPFYVAGVYNYSSGISLNVKGLTNYGSGILLSLTGKESFVSGLSLYINGANYTTLNSTLYTHGF